MDDREIFLRLLAQHDGIIHKVAAGYSSSLADRHDLMQEIRLQLWKAYPRYAPDRPFSTWMYRIALNVAISFLRKNSRPARQTVPLDALAHEVPNDSSVLPQIDERIAILQQVIAALDPSRSRPARSLSRRTQLPRDRGNSRAQRNQHRH